MKLPELKKCPFCASGARFMFQSGFDSVYVECIHCKARAQGFCVSGDEAKFIDSMFECVEAAAGEWNKRRWLPE